MRTNADIESPDYPALLRSLYEDHYREFGDRPVTLEGLFEVQGRRMGREIVLLPVEVPDDLACGLLLEAETGGELFVVYPDNGPEDVQNQIKAHELAHLVFGDKGVHADAAQASAGWLGSFFPDTNPATLLGRTVGSYGREREARAETFATVLNIELANPAAIMGPHHNGDMLDQLFGGSRRRRTW